MLLRWSLGLADEAAAVEAAVAAVLDAGYRTADIAQPDEISVSTCEMGDQLVNRI
jgi:3-isopropylmalate dehydrogenase